MRDKVSDKRVKEIVNEVLADTVWGAVSETNGKWLPQVGAPSTKRPSHNGVDIISYNEWLAREHPGSKNKKLRNQKAGVFSEEGEPGSAFAETARSLSSKLENPDGSPVQIIPAFFELLLYLKREKRSFTICFRTFGEDLGAVVEEFNSFCEGMHPLYPGARLDGSDGDTDYRVKPGDPDQCGIFYRDTDALAIVMGTWESPEREKDPSLKFYDRINGATVKQFDMQNLYNFLLEKCRRPGTMALRDYFPYWKNHEMASDAGKILFCQSPHPDSQEHWMFFDDNIRHNDTYIVDVRNPTSNTKTPSVGVLLQSHIRRAEPLESIGGKDYFINAVADLEAGLKRRLKARQRLKKVIMLVRTVDVIRCKTAEILPDYDPWRGQRPDDRDLSLPANEDVVP